MPRPAIQDTPTETLWRTHDFLCEIEEDVAVFGHNDERMEYVQTAILCVLEKLKERTV